MCYYLNVHFQGQRVNRTLNGPGWLTRYICLDFGGGLLRFATEAGAGSRKCQVWFWGPRSLQINWFNELQFATHLHPVHRLTMSGSVPPFPNELSVYRGLILKTSVMVPAFKPKDLSLVIHNHYYIAFLFRSMCHDLSI